MCVYGPGEVGFEEGRGDEKGVVRGGGYIEKVLGENTETSAFSFLALSGYYCCLWAGGRDISTLR